MRTYYIPLTFVIALFTISCSKDKTKAQDDFKNICFQGRYIGKDCSDVVQIISPVGKLNLKNSSWARNDSTSNYVEFENVIGTQLPDKYKDGNPFYFHINFIGPLGIHTMNCAGPLNVAELVNLSRTPCDFAGNSK